MHHIVPEVNGGANTLDNAITLCFDCHADAGHYSILHPRGTKFSSNELKLARDVWHKTVKKNEITDEPRQQDSLYCRYLICRDFGAIREVVQGNLSKLPVTTPVLANAPTLPFLKEVVQAHKEDYRVARKWGGAFDSNDHYIQSHPDAKKISETEIDGQKFWEFERTPSSEELQQNVLNHDYISRSLFEHGMPTVEVCRLRAVTNYCGNPPLQEEYQLRPLWAVFLAITNSSGNRIRLNTIEGAVNNGAFDTVRTLDSHDTENPISLLCPQAELLPEWTAIIPVATILAPLGVIIEEEGYGTRSEVEPALVQALTHVFMANETTNECYTWGPRFRVSAIRFTQEGAEYVQEMHELDVANVYVIDRHWMMGCCPHVFAVRSTGEVDYLGEIFTLLTSDDQQCVIVPRKEHRWIVVAELEEEITTISSGTQNDKILAKNVRLRQGDFVTFRLMDTSPLVLKGRYELLRAVPRKAYKDNNRIEKLVRSFSSQLTVDQDRPH